MPVAYSVSVIPELEDLKTEGTYAASDPEQKRGLRVHKRVDQMLDARAPFEGAMQRSLLLYDGISLLNPKQKAKLKNEQVVAPFARIFVEAKTAEEVKSFSEYEFIPVEDAGDSWRVELLKEVNTHVQRKVKLKAKRHEMIRMKNIAGVGIARVGYRRIFGKRKIRIEDDAEPDTLKYEEKDVPVYDDLFFDVVSPFNFAIDPNAKTMDDAMDCVHFHAENFESFWEAYSNNKLFKNCEHVRPGKHGRFTSKGFETGHFRSQQAQENMVVICEYFNKLRDEWCVYANGIEIYYGALPDDHKDLPFISFHNNATFCTGYVENMTAYTADGDELSSSQHISSEETFWTEGDPATIMDLIDLRTAFGRAAYRALKLAGENLILTQGNFSLDESRPWTSGTQVPGGMGKVQTMPLGGTPNIGGYEFTFNDIFNLMIMVTGVDPRNLADDTKQKTATEAAIQRETSMRRLEQGIEWNEENGETRMGMLMHKLIQQWYTKPKIERLLGTETQEELDEKYDDVENDSDTGRPKYGMRYRRIRTNFNVKESNTGGHLTLKKNDAGTSSFIARPEYIRTSDIDVAVATRRKIGQIQAIESAQADEMVQLLITILPFAQPDPTTGAPGLIDPSHLPNFKAAMEKWAKAKGLDPKKDMGQNGGKQETKEDRQVQALKQHRQQRQPITNTPPPDA